MRKVYRIGKYRAIYVVSKQLRKFSVALSNSKGSPVILAMISEFNGPYMPIYETGIVPKPLTQRSDVAAIKMIL